MLNKNQQTVLVLAITISVNILLVYIQTNQSIQMQSTRLMRQAPSLRPIISSSVFANSASFSSASSFSASSSASTTSRPKLIVITPTHKRPAQIPDLIRLKQTLSLLTDCDWLVVEDDDVTNPTVESYISDYKSGQLTYVAVKSQDPFFRGMKQRNRALQLIRSNPHYQEEQTKAVLYFADDDNSYDYRFLDSLRFTKKISLFSVGLISNRTVEGPIVENNKVVGFRTAFYSGRKFCIDMAGFAINLKLVIEAPTVQFVSTQKGRQESDFLQLFGIPLDQMEYFHGSNGLHVWHTQTVKTSTEEPHLMVFYKNNTIINLKTKTSSPLDSYKNIKIIPYKKHNISGIHETIKKDQKSRSEIIISYNRSKKEKQEEFKKQLRGLNAKQRLEVTEFLKYQTEKELKIFNITANKQRQTSDLSNWGKADSIQNSVYLDSLL